MSLPNPSHLSCNTPSTAITHNASNINVAQIVFLNPATYPDAVCNDGTAAAYAIRPGSGAAANRWVILLQGGDNCYDQASCSARAAGKPALISSTPYRSNPDLAPQMDGVQSSSPSTNPDFYDATQVQALYCSSDYWSGAKSGAGTFNPNDDATWNFQGRAILSAVIADLEQNYGLSSASEILLTGESAGGVGVYATVNDVTKLVPATARFVASSDAGFGNIAADFNASGAPPDYTSSATPFYETTGAQALALWNGHGDSACAGTAATLAAQLGCYEAAQLLAPNGTIALPMLVIEAQRDTVQLNHAGVAQADLNSGNFTPAESGYVSYFAAQMRANLVGTNASVSIFSPDALLHTEANNSTLFNTSYSFPAGSFDARQVVGAWYENPCAAQRDIAD